MKPPSMGALSDGSGEVMALRSKPCGAMGDGLALLNCLVGGALCSNPYCCNAGLLSYGRGGLLVFLGRGPEEGLAFHGSGVPDRETSALCGTWSTGSLRFLPKSLRVARRRGFICGTGGGLSIPFFKDAPTGRSIVSTLDVEESSATGSEISCLLIVFLRRGT